MRGVLEAAREIGICRKRAGPVSDTVSLMRKPRPALFRGRYFGDQIIILCVRWYLRCCLTYRQGDDGRLRRDDIPNTWSG